MRYSLFIAALGVLLPEAVGLVNFAPGVRYEYKYSGVQQITDLAQVHVRAEVGISLESQVPHGQRCRLEVDSYKVHVKYENLDNEPEVPHLNFSNSFQFEISRSGEVTRVWYRAESDGLVVTLQKMLLSALTSKLMMTNQQLNQGVPWAYRINETGHTGVHEAIYKASPTHDHVLFVKAYQTPSVQGADEDISKEIKYNKMLRVPEKVRWKGHFRSPTKSKDGYIPLDGLGTPVTDQTAYSGLDNPEFPSMHTTARVDVDLRRMGHLDDSSYNNTGVSLREDTLDIGEIPLPTISLTDATLQIQGNISCMVQAITSKAPDKAIPCFHNAVLLLKRLTSEDLGHLTLKYLKNKSLDRQQCMLDVLFTIESGPSLIHVTHHVLNATRPNAELVLRSLAHLTNLKRPPSKVMLRVLELRAFRTPYNIEDKHLASQVNERLVLILGVLARKLRQWDPAWSQKITKLLEKRLGVHDQVTHRQKRSVMTDEEYYGMVQEKSVHMLALGNAAAESSLDRLYSYGNSTDRPVLWRRSLISALSRYHSHQAAESLLNVALTDHNRDVKMAAIHEYQKHPHGGDLSPLLHESHRYNSNNVTNALHPRTKRSLENILSRIWKGFQFKLESPSMSWRKNLGGSMLGASLGLIIKNLLDINISPLSSHVIVDVQDEAWATLHLGMIGQDLHVFKAEICFQGHIKFDLNILKEFGFDDVLEFAMKYAKIVMDVYNNLKNAVEQFRALVTESQNFDVGAIFEKLKKAIADLPEKLLNFPSIGQGLLEDLAKYDGLPPVVEKVRDLVLHIRQVFTDIRTDVMGLYNSVIDTVTITLPWAWEEITTAFNDIIEAIQMIIQNPKTAINQMGRSATRIFTAITAVLAAKGRINEANIFKKDNHPYWFDVGGVIAEILDQLKDLKQELKDAFSLQNVKNHMDDVAVKYTGVSMTQMRRQIFEKLETLLSEEFDDVFQDITMMLKPFQETTALFSETITTVKEAWVDLKEGYEQARTLLESVFGPKLSQDFPRKYLLSGFCGEGFYSSTGKGNYQHSGVDVEVTPGSKIVAPFEGTINSTGPRQVMIQVRGMKDVTVYLDNVDLKSELEGQDIGSGETIGTVLAPGWCSDGHVHLAMVKSTTGDVIDPSRYLERRELKTPKWVQECDQYQLVWKGDVISSGRVAGTPEEEDKTPDIKDAPDLSSMNWDELKINIGDHDSDSEEGDGGNSDGSDDNGGSDNGSTDIGDKLGDFGASLGLPSIQNLKSLFQFRMGSLKVNKVFDFLEKSGLTYMKDRILPFLRRLKKSRSERGWMRPESLDINELKKQLKIRGFPTNGSRKALIERYKQPDLSCPALRRYFKDNMYCRFGSRCLSFSCMNDLKFFAFKHPVSLFGKVDPCTGTVSFGVNDWIFEHNFIKKPKGAEGSLSLNTNRNMLIVSQLALKYRVEVFVESIKISLNVTWCSARAEDCREGVALVKGIDIPLPNCTWGEPEPAAMSLSSSALSEVPGLEGLSDLSLDEIIDIIFTSGLSGDMVNKFLEDLRTAVRQWVIEQIQSLPGKDLKNAFGLSEMCNTAYEINFGPNMVEFFKFTFPIPLGPLPLVFRIGAEGHYGASFQCSLCIMSMKVEARVVPAIGAQAWGALGLQVVFLTAELRLTGHVLETSFPTKAEIGFSKFPLDVKARMDMHLRPLRLELHARLVFEMKFKVGWVKVHIRNVLINKLLWQYSTDPIQKNIFNYNDAEQDDSPPEFLSYTKSECVNCDRPKRSATKVTCYNCWGDGRWSEVRHKRDLLHARRHDHRLHVRSGEAGRCNVKQLEGRDYTEPAFNIELGVDDDKSEVDLEYCVGTVPGGCDVVNHESMGGPSSIVSKRLVSGIPLYFTVCASNSAGGVACTTCSIPTYDTTLPSGRVTPDFLTTSHPHILRGSTFMVEDSELDQTQLAIGFGRGIEGHQVLHWTPLNRVEDNGAAGAQGLQQFSAPRPGRLVAKPLSISTRNRADDCAKDCLARPTTICRGFNFVHEGNGGKCELMGEVEGQGTERHQTSGYLHYERKGIGQKASFDFKNLQLVHNNLYYYNVHLKNVLEYSTILSSDGVLVDLTPPEPGPVPDASKDVLLHRDCDSFVPNKLRSRCVQQTPVKNFRRVVDGPSSLTVFNGLKPANEQRYTRSNTSVSANWDGIRDTETGILVYTWAVGTQPCGHDVITHDDPHGHLSDESQWSHLGHATGLKLSDGYYFTTVRAMNKIEFGGPMALEVCHSTPLIVDTTPPLFYQLKVIDYDAENHVIHFEFNTSDPLSGIMRTEFGLGHTRKDTHILGWRDAVLESPAAYNQQIEDGVKTWVKLRVTNNVDLRTVGHSDKPILIDMSPPIAGVVYDGEDIHQGDLVFQSSTTRICACWDQFYDEQSGILKYQIGVGSAPHLDDIVPNEEVGRTVHHKCWSAFLEHNTLYVSTVTAFNNGFHELNVTEVSNGVTVDATPPVAGSVKDGRPEELDITYSSEAASACVSWHGYYDPESGVTSYRVTFWRRHKASGSVDTDIHTETVPSGQTDLCVHHLHLHHGDTVHAEVVATNGAKSTSTARSDGFIVDLTEPRMRALSDGDVPGKDAQYTASTSELSASWNYTDPESDVDRYKTKVYLLKGGTRTQIYPTSGEEKTLPADSTGLTTDEELNLEAGMLYNFRVAAVNRAKLTAVHHTDGVVVDNTPPKLLWVHAGSINGEPEELDDGFVLHNEKDGIWGSWLGVDPQSGVETYFVAIGTSPGAENALPFTDVGKETSHYIKGFAMSLTNSTINTPVYYITVKCTNRAGMMSGTVSSSAVKLVEGDKTGHVMDGVDFGQDLSYQSDITTILASFYGFQSAKNGIAHYLWAVGTKPGSDDVMPFVMENIAVEDESVMEEADRHYYAQSMLPLQEGTTYYTTVRAITGVGHVLESSSNGVSIDTSPPVARFVQLGPEDVESETKVVYQKEADSISASWNITDAQSDVDTTNVILSASPVLGDELSQTQTVSYQAIGSLPNAAVHPLTDGQTNMLTLLATNQAGLETSLTSYPVVVDQTPAEDGQVHCPRFIAGENYFSCEWSGFTDKESTVTGYKIGLGEFAGDDSAVPFKELPASVQHFTFTELKTIGLIHNKRYKVTVQAINGVRLVSPGETAIVVVDGTPPTGGLVIELSSSTHTDSGGLVQAAPCPGPPGTLVCIEHDITCQRSVNQLIAEFEPFVDEESGISRYEVSVGSTPGGSQVQDFKPLPEGQTKVTLNDLDLSQVRQAFVTIKGYNGAGQYSVSTSNGVFISRISAGLPPLIKSVVYDGEETDHDLDYQVHNDGLGANWNFHGDPCPLQRQEWSVFRVDGHVVLPFTELPPDQRYAEVDELQLHDGETFYTVVRATNLLGHVYAIQSDGVTIRVEPLLPGVVRDGDIVGFDLVYQQSITTLSANWDGFGSQIMNVEPGSLSADLEAERAHHQVIDHYEVAAGTDRRFPLTRENIHPFINVGLNKTWTFDHLQLQPKTAVYYMTVRAVSVSTASVQVTSNGIKVGMGGGVISLGEVTVDRYVPSAVEVEFSWKNFRFTYPVLFYQWGLGTYDPQIYDIDCQDLEHGEDHHRTSGNYSHLFDVQELTTSVSDTYMKATGLSLVHNQRYHVVIIAVDQTGVCQHAVANFTVDTTDPESGILHVGHDFGKSVVFVRDADTMTISWTDFRDPESGIDKFEVALIEGSQCTPPSEDEADREYITLGRDLTSYRAMELQLQASIPYYVFLRTTNGAGSRITTISKTIMLDTIDPSAGTVIDGNDVMHDLKFKSTISEFKGTLLYLPSPTSEACPTRTFTMTMPDTAWSSVQNRGLNGRSSHSIMYQHKHLTLDTPDGAALPLRRDVSGERMLAASVYSKAYVGRGGAYEFELKAAEEGLHAVTSVCIRDGPKGVVWDYLDNQNSHSEVDREGPVIVPDPVEGDTNDGRPYSWNQLRAFGMQVRTETEGNLTSQLTMWVKGFNDTLTTTTLDFDFDPSDGWHSYRLVVNENDPNPAVDDGSLTLHVDGKVRAMLTGVPSLSDEAVFQVQVWNEDGWLPEVTDVFNAPETAAYIRNVALPPKADEPCRFASAFRGGTSPVEAVYAGVGTEPLSDDAVQFKKVAEPCLPCSGTCLECDPGCSENSLHDLHLSVEAPELQLPARADNTSELPVYYLTVKTITGSGREALASSDGLYIDVTPPEIRYVMHLDMSYSGQEPVTYQGSNSTISVVWEATDDESKIVEYLWAIGTHPGGSDVQPFTSTGQDQFASNTQLEGVLHDNQTYFVTVQAINEASLMTNLTSDGVTVLLTPPDESSTQTNVEGAEPLAVEETSRVRRSASPVTIMRSEYQDRLKVSWGEPNTKALSGIYFSVSSGPDHRADIFPRGMVGYNVSGSVELNRNGFFLSGEKVSNISDARDKTEGHSDSSGNEFFMEPGRILFSEVEVCTKAHICGYMANKIIIVMRKNDNTTHVIPGGRLNAQVYLSTSMPVKISSSVQSEQATLAYGALSREDIEKRYTSAASNTFLPYISDPNLTGNQTDRHLYQRVAAFDNNGFFLTTLPGQTIQGPLSFRYTFNTSVYTEEILKEFAPGLLTWDKENQMWIDAAHACPPHLRNSKFQGNLGIAEINICGSEAGNSRSRTKRSTINKEFNGPKVFMLAKVSTKFINHPPSVTSSTSYSMPEDAGTLRLQLTGSDPENDLLLWRRDMTSQLPLGGTATLHADGTLTYRPCENCYGSEVIKVMLTEDRTDGEEALTTLADIQVHVSQVNDAPDLFLLDRFGKLQDLNIYNEITVLLEENKVGQINMHEATFVIGAMDVDGSDKINIRYQKDQYYTLSASTEMSRFPPTSCHDNVRVPISDYVKQMLQGSSSQANFPVPCEVVENVPATDLSFSGQVIQYKPPIGYHGYEKLQAIAEDHTNRSEIMTVNVYVLANRCENNGTCQGPQDDPACTGTRRAQGFSGYHCLCLPGFTGVYCEVNIDECVSATCPRNYTCVDGINSYKCHCEYGWPCSYAQMKPHALLWQLAFTGFVPAGLIVAVIVFYFMKKKNKNYVEPFDGTQDGDDETTTKKVTSNIFQTDNASLQNHYWETSNNDAWFIPVRSSNKVIPLVAMVPEKDDMEGELDETPFSTSWPAPPYASQEKSPETLSPDEDSEEELEAVRPPTTPRVAWM